MNSMLVWSKGESIGDRIEDVLSYKVKNGCLEVVYRDWGFDPVPLKFLPFIKVRKICAKGFAPGEWTQFWLIGKEPFRDN